MADLWFHSLVALSYYKLSPEDVLQELSRREGLGGLEEKALRKAKARESGED
jgi:phosphoribosyl-ATP pyrophosphohydrolase